MKKILLLLFLSASIISCGQNCGLVSSFKNRKSGERQFTGIVISEKHHTLILNKTIRNKDSIVNTEFIISLATNIILPDSVVKSMSELRLSLKSGNILTVDSVKCSNVPFGSGRAGEFEARLTKEELYKIQTDPIITYTINKIIETTFSEKSQKQQMNIASCLLKY